MKSIRIFILTFSITISQLYAFSCADSSQNLSEQIAYTLNNPWPMIIVCGQILKVNPKHQYDKSYMNSMEHVDYSLEVLLTYKVLGELSTDTIEIIPGPSFLNEYKISNFEIGTSWIFFLQTQVKEIWKDLKYPSKLYLGKTCGHPIESFNNLFSEGIDLDILIKKFEGYNSKIISHFNKKK